MRYTLPYSEEESLDVKNPIYDLLINEEELIPAANRIRDDIVHIDSRLRSLEDTNPHQEALREAAGSALTANFDVNTNFWNARNAIDELNFPSSHNSDPVRLMMGLANGAFGVAVAAGGIASVVPPAAVAAGAVNLAVGGYIGATYIADSLEREQEAKRLVNFYLDFSDAIHKGREDFDEAWLRLIGDEDRDRLPDEE